VGPAAFRLDINLAYPFSRKHLSAKVRTFIDFMAPLASSSLHRPLPPRWTMPAMDRRARAATSSRPASLQCWTSLELQGLYLFGALTVVLLGAGRFSVGGTNGRWN
jgi:hypothetical protein